MKKLFTYVLMLCASLSVSVAQQIQYPEPILNPRVVRVSWSAKKPRQMAP